MRLVFVLGIEKDFIGVLNEFGGELMQFEVDVCM